MTPSLLFTTSTNPSIERTLVQSGNFRRGKQEWRQFADGEWCVRLGERVRGIEPVVLGSTVPPADSIVKLLILLDALRENGSRPATLLLPYFGYARQDRPTHAGEGVAARLFARILGDRTHVRTIVVVDLHSPTARRFFPVSVTNVEAMPLLMRALKRARIQPEVVVAPDAGAIPRARACARAFGATVGWCRKNRPRPNVASIGGCRGAAVKKKRVLIVDDMIDTGGTLIGATRVIRNAGAREIIVAVTHSIFSGNPLPTIKAAGVRRLFVTDSIPHPKLPAWVTVVPVARLFL